VFPLDSRSTPRCRQRTRKRCFTHVHFARQEPETVEEIRGALLLI
jgi:hypothetical protein